MSNFPTLAQVERACPEELVRWNRFLPTPMTEEGLAVINRIVERLREEKEKNPRALVAASKAVGW